MRTWFQGQALMPGIPGFGDFLVLDGLGWV